MPAVHRGRLVVPVLAVALACAPSEPPSPAPSAVRPLPERPKEVVTAPRLDPVESAIAPLPREPVDPAPEARTPAGKRVPLRVSRIEIGDLGVVAPVVDVGVLPDGQLEIPPDPGVLGRWSGGAQAGDPVGSLVLVGHVDTAASGPGALFRVRELTVGALILVGDKGRSAIAYRVSALHRVAKDDLVPSTDPFRQDVPHRLVIITCGGPFDRRTRHYRDNVVVLADVVDP